MDNLREKAVKSVFWVGSGRFVGQIFSWIVTIYLVRILSPSDFGLYAMGTVYISMVVIIYDFNLGSAILQKKDITDEEISTCFWIVIFLSFLFYALSWFLASLIASFFEQKDVELIIKVMGIGLIFQSANLVPSFLLAKRLEFKKRAKAVFYSAFLSNPLTLVVAMLGGGVWSLVIRFIAHQILLLIFTFYFFRWRPLFYLNLKKMKPLLKFGLSVTGFGILRYFSENSGKIIVGKVFGDNLLGYYSVALNLSRIPINKVIMIINQVSFPVFSKLQNDNVNLKRYFLKITKMISVFAFPALVGGALLAEELVRVFLGEKWLSIVLILQILCCVAIPQTLVGTITALNNACGKPRINLKFAAGLATFLTVAILFGVRFELTGVAIAWIVVYPFLFLYILFKSVKEIELKTEIFIKNLSGPFFGCLIMTVIFLIFKKYWFLEERPITTVIYLIMIGAGVYTGSIYLFARKTFNEIFSVVQDLGVLRFIRRFRQKKADHAVRS